MSGPVIIGGGPGGVAAAIAIARAGRAVRLIERSADASDKVCGDFLSAEAMAMVEAFGISLSMASPIHSVRLIHGRRIACTRLPFRAVGLTRRTLDEALLRQAQVCGATLLRGHRVTAIEQRGVSLRLASSSLGPIVSDTVFLATGKHELRGTMRSARSTGLIGLKMYYMLNAMQCHALRGHIELVLFAGGYGGLQLVEGERAVFCALVSSDRMRAAGGRWDTLVEWLTDACPHLCERLSGAQPLLERPLAIAGLPYGYSYRPHANDVPGLFRLGDQAVVIGSLTGDGVALALASGGLAARAWLAGRDAASYHQRLAAGVSRQMRLASAIHWLCLSADAQPLVSIACRRWPAFMRIAAVNTRAYRLGDFATPI